jgi:1-acyl-sn-glycerol-3-phosphate acyltransferase
MTYTFFRAMFRLIFRFFFRVQIIGREFVPNTGGAFICSNHMSNWDPPMVGSPLKRKLRFMAKEELFKIPVVGRILPKLGAFPIKRGAVGKQVIVDTLRMVRSGEMVCIFPEGTRKGGTPQRGAGFLALKGNAAVVPSAIIGTYRLFRPMKVVYGPPLDLTALVNDPEDDGTKAAEVIMSKIRELIAEHA